MASHVGAVELDEFAGGDDAVEDRFSDDCVVQGLVPVLGVELGGDQCGSSAFSGGEDVEQFAGGLTGPARVRSAEAQAHDAAQPHLDVGGSWIDWDCMYTSGDTRAS